MPIISISRRKEWINRYKVFEFYFDGKRIGYVANGETKEFEVPAGEHKLKVKMGWHTSKDLIYTQFNKDMKVFYISTNWIVMLSTPLFICIIGLIMILLKNSLLRNFKIGHFHIPLFESFILLISAYFFTIGRNNYLIIKGDKNQNGNN